MNTIKIIKDCPRTFALFQTGQSIPGLACTFVYSGKVPCTGRRVCFGCGQVKQFDTEEVQS